MEYELECLNDTRRSFYGKAKVRVDDNKLILRSYATDVAMINKETNTAEVYGTYSQTTLRYIKEFLKQQGFKAETSKQILKDYGVDEQW